MRKAFARKLSSRADGQTFANLVCVFCARRRWIEVRPDNIGRCRCGGVFVIHDGTESPEVAT